ncbi:M18 family aminopeptidase [Porticoccaceae bacterium]|nr:M18 family aminopeptidase [Porticoccaceae bacterium]
MADSGLLSRHLMAFLDASPTPFHAVESMQTLLNEASFSRLDESQEWQLEAGGRYYLTRNGSSIIAFVHGSEDVAQGGLRMVGAHTDSPCLMVKPHADIFVHGYHQLSVEVYGGALLNPWFDRDLGIAGRVVFSDEQGLLRSRLVDFKRPMAVIPSLAIHLDREANSRRTINPQTDIKPILLQSGESPFNEIISAEFLSAGEQLVDYELALYDCSRAAFSGANSEFISSARLDNQLSCFAGLQALLKADGRHTAVLVCNDHEEVGSVSAVGADGPFLQTLLARLCGQQLDTVLAASLLLSCDNAHALHPNFPAVHDTEHLPALNGGPVIKTNVKQRYASNALGSALVKQLGKQCGVPLQSFAARNDMGCGSTIGPISAAKLGVNTLDIGIAQLAMHSCRELTGARDPARLVELLAAFINSGAPLTVVAE